jgi:hypothetical protein
VNLSTIKINKFGSATQLDLITEIVEFDHGLDTVKTTEHHQLEFPEVTQEVVDNSLMFFHSDLDMTKISTSTISPFSANNKLRLNIIDKMVSFSNTKMRVIRKSKTPTVSAYPVDNAQGYSYTYSSEIPADYHWDLVENGITWKTHWNYKKVYEDTSYHDEKNQIWYHCVINNNSINYDIAIELIADTGIYRSDWYNVTPGATQYIPMKDIPIIDESILKNYYDVGSAGLVVTSYESTNDRLKLVLSRDFSTKTCGAIIECSNDLFLTTGEFILSSTSATTNYINDSDWVFDYTRTLNTYTSGAAIDFDIPVISSETSNPFTALDMRLIYKDTGGAGDSFDWRLSGTSYTISTSGTAEVVKVADILISGDPNEAYTLHIENIINKAAIVGVEVVRKRVGYYDSIIIQGYSDTQQDFDTVFGITHSSAFDHRYAYDRKWLRSEESLISSANWLMKRSLPSGQSLTTTVTSHVDLNVEYVLSSVTNFFPTPIIEYTFGTNDMTAVNDWYFREYRGDQYKDIVHARNAGKIVSVIQTVNLENSTKFQFKGLGNSADSKYFYLQSFKTTYLKFTDFNPVGNKIDFYSVIEPTGQSFILGKEKLKFLIKSVVAQDIKNSDILGG